MTADRFVQCQHCGRVYQLPTTPDHLQTVLSRQSKQHNCYATYRMIFGEVRPCESEVFREITAAEARVWREPVYLVVPQWYQQEYHALSGYQEAMVLVKGGYAPDLIVVQHGRPVRLKFRREESAACSEMVIFSDFGKSARLPEGEMVPIEFLPERPGEYEFTCQMGMLRGRLVVE